MGRISFTISMVIFFQDLANATNESSLFEIFGVDNTPLKSSFTVSLIRCALACHISNECQGFSYASQMDATDVNCFTYHWLTPGGGSVGAFATRPNGNTTSPLILDDGVTAELSSGYPNSYYHGLYAIDGIYESYQSVAHTKVEISPWLQINLESPALVRGVKIWNRLYESRPGVALRLKNVLASVAMTRDNEGFGERLTESACSYSPGAQPPVRLHLCYKAMNGKHVRITAVNVNDHLNLWEVEVHV